MTCQSLYSHFPILPCRHIADKTDPPFMFLLCLVQLRRRTWFNIEEEKFDQALGQQGGGVGQKLNTCQAWVCLCSWQSPCTSGALPEPSLSSALPKRVGKGLWGALGERRLCWLPLKQAGTRLAAPEGIKSCLQPWPFWWQLSSSWPWVLKVCFCALILQVSPWVFPVLCLVGRTGSSFLC